MFLRYYAHKETTQLSANHFLSSSLMLKNQDIFSVDADSTELYVFQLDDKKPWMLLPGL
jgi:hypothetical protein